MKTVLIYKLTLTGLLTCAAQAAHADTGFANGGLWRAPVVTSVSVGAQPANAELNSDCDYLESIDQRFAPFSDAEHAKVFDETRKAPAASNFPQSTYSVALSVGLRNDGTIASASDLSSLSSQAQTLAANESRLHFTQAIAAESLDPQSLTIKSVTYTNTSLSASAAKLGLSALPVQFRPSGNGLVAVISGKDLACDLVRGRAQLNVVATATAQIPLDAQVKLKMYYTSLSAVIGDVVARFQRPKARAAMVGFGLGRYFASQNDISKAQAENAVVDALDSYLTSDTLGFNSLWSMVDQKPQLNLNGISQPFPVQVTIGHAGTGPSHGG